MGNKILFNTAGFDEPQALGADLSSGFNDVWFVNRKKPTNLIYAGGHEIVDAPTVNVTEGKMITDKKKRNGRNVNILRQITSDIATDGSINLTYPSKRRSVLEQIIQLQENGCEFDMFLIPSQCDSGCDSWAMKAENPKVGIRRYTSAMSGRADNELEMASESTVKFSGDFVNYDGLSGKVLSTRAQALSAVLMVDDLCANDCGCPYQTHYVAGAVGLMEVSTDGGKTYTAVDTALVIADLAGAIITDLAYSGTRVVGVYSDVLDGVGLDGGAFYLNSSGVAVLSALYNTDGTTPYVTLGLQSIVKVFNKLYAFGTAGEVFVSCDNGLTYTLVTVPAGMTETTIDTAIDIGANVLYIAQTGGDAWMYDGTTFTAISNIGTVADLVAVNSPVGHSVQFIDGNGVFYESYEYVVGNAFVIDYTFPASGNALVSGGDQYRTIVGAGALLYPRHILNDQTFSETDTITVASGDYLAGVAGKPSSGRIGEYFLLVTDAGEIVEYADCYGCTDSDC